MRKFIIEETYREYGVNKYEVLANSKEEAIDLVKSGEIEILEKNCQDTDLAIDTVVEIK